MLTQENIEQLILNFISKKIDEMKEIEQSHLNKYQNDFKDLEQKWRKLEDFHSLHLEELNDIWPVKSFHSPYNSHLGTIFHEMSRHHMYLEEGLEMHKKNISRVNGFANISYQQISDELGLNAKSVKKYLDILLHKGKIEKKRDIGGLFYKICETI